ncbi:MAG TPA: methyltransferase domain-containing protein [Solirubrobacteraceae bacterium]
MTRGSQSDVDAHFDAAARWWRDVYEAPTTEGAVYRRRRDRVLALVDELRLPAGSDVLEVGAGAGVVAVELARRGHRVKAVEPSEAMLAVLRERAAAGGVADHLTAATADVHALDEPSDAFDLVVAIGVVPWLHAPQAGLREMARVARPGAAVILTSDNRARLSSRIDPRRRAPLRPVLQSLRRTLRRRGVLPTPAPSDFLMHLYDRDELLAMLSAAGLEPERVEPVGYGPFAPSGQPLLPERAMIRLEAALQRRADRGARLLRDASFQHIVLARAR